MKNQPFILPLCGLVLGILLAEYLPNYQLNQALSFFFVFFYVFLLGYFIYRRRYTLVFFVLFIRIGFFLAETQNRFTPIPSIFQETENWIQLEIEEVYKPSEKYRKYKAKIISIDSIKIAQTNLLLYWKREFPMIHPSDQVWVNAKIQPSPKALNPHQFDYSQYLKRQKIRYVSFVLDPNFHLQEGNSFWHFTSSYKRNIHQKLQESSYSKNSADIIGAMILGDRTEMDDEVQETYRKTGVVHILSVSGLHIMIVYTMFYVLLYPLIYLKNGRIIRILASLILIWSYVLLVGFQPPILRSALMITVFHGSYTFQRKPNIYHTLAVTALVLLCINTNFLFDVGFQLSYSAVFFIVYLHPVYQKLFRPKTKTSRYTIGFVGTSISAQLGTFPIAAYYFHQTSGLFLAGNLVMILASNLMIAGGMISILLIELKISFPMWTLAFNGFIELCNQYMDWLSGFDFLIFERIHFEFWEVILLLLMIVLLNFILTQPKFKPIVLLISILFIFQIQRHIRIHELNAKKEIIVFHQYKNSVIGLRNGKEMDVYIQNISDTVNLQKYLLKSYSIKENIKEIRFFEMHEPQLSFYGKSHNLIVFKERKFLVMNENYRHITSDVDFILIQSNSKLLMDSISNQTEFMLDGSNYPNHLGQTNKEFWRTHEMGAKIIRLR